MRRATRTAAPASWPTRFVGAVVLLLAAFTQAQTSQFVFDPNGNLLAQTQEISSPPQIIGQPQTRVVAPGDMASFSVVAANTRGLTYQWRFNGITLVDETNDTLQVKNVNLADEGDYSVVLQNSSGIVASAPAMLWVDSDADGVGDSFEVSHFTNLNQTASGDFDGDGVSNLQEFLDGTDPRDSQSARFRVFVLHDGGSVLKSPDRASYTNGETVTLTAVTTGNEPFHAWTGDIVTRSNSLTLVMTNNKSFFAHFNPVVFLWTNAASGDWNIAENWTPNLVPGSNDSVVITRTVTVTLDTAADCANVTLGSVANFPGPSSPTLTGPGTLTVRASLQWIAGSMAGSGRTVLETGATLYLDNPGTLTLSGRHIETGGATIWNGVGNISLNNNAIFTNRPGAIFYALNPNSTVSGGSGGRFDNAGTFYKPANSGATTVANNVRFNSDGTVTLAPDTSLRLSGGGSASGIVEAPATALVEWTTGTFTLNPGAQLNGNGLFKVNSGTLAVNADLTVENLDLVGGALEGTGTLTIANAMNWTAGSMGGGGRTIISPNVTLNAALAGGAILNPRTLENRGTVIWTGPGNVGVNGAVITNCVGALFHAQSAASLVSVGAASRFDNAGTFRKSANDGTTAITSFIHFNNYALTEVQTGTLSLNGGGMHAGSFELAAGASVTLAGIHNTTASSSITGSGQFAVTGGQATLGGLVNVSGTNTFSGGTANCAGQYICTNVLVISGGTANFDGASVVAPVLLTLSSGTLGGSSVVSVGAIMNWTGGAMSGSGRTIIPFGAALNAAIPSVAILITRTLENAGTALWTGAGNIGLSGAIITNRPGALFHVQNAANLVNVGAGGRFDNAGTFRKSVNSGPTTLGSSIPFHNFGTVDIRTGTLVASGGYISGSAALLSCAIGGTTAGAGHGQVQITGNVTLNGSLSVELINNFTPSVNDAFPVLTAGARSGAFANFAYPSNQVTMQISNTPTSVIVRVNSVLVPQPVLLTPVISSSNVILSWTSLSNIIYRLESKPDLGATNWNAILGDITASSNTATASDPLTPSNRFYRVRVVQ